MRPQAMLFASPALREPRLKTSALGARICVVTYISGPVSGEEANFKDPARTHRVGSRSLESASSPKQEPASKGELDPETRPSPRRMVVNFSLTMRKHGGCITPTERRGNPMPLRTHA